MKTFDGENIVFIDKNVYVVIKDWYYCWDNESGGSENVCIFLNKEEAEKFAKEENEKQEKYDKLWETHSDKIMKWHYSAKIFNSTPEQYEEERKIIAKEIGLPEECITNDFIRGSFSVVEVPVILPEK
jgi:hypothetical protein